ncbi:MAG: phasin family protein [Alphaproteobacteria bacterium]|nr:phasin family protein [Alphaproteobacteria bacterium]
MQKGEKFMAKESHTSSCEDRIFNPFKKMKCPMFNMEMLMTNTQKNIELMTETQQIFAESLKSIMELQNEYFKKVMDQWNEQVKCCCSKAPLEEKTAHQAEAKKTAINQAVEHARELSSIISKSSEKIIGSVQKRIKEGLDESLNLEKKSKKNP